MAALFVSDLHLCPSRPAANRLFFDFLAGPARQAKSLYILGDLFEYLAGDDDYQTFRAEVRSDAWRRAFLALPLTRRREKIEALRNESEMQKRTKPMAIMDVNRETVVAVLREHKCARLIHGHTHRPAHHTLQVDSHACECWVLADWYENGGYLACGALGCRMVDWPGRS